MDINDIIAYSVPRMNLPLSWKMQCLHTAAVGCATVPCYGFYLWSGVEWETSNATFMCVGLSVGLGVCGETCCMCITVCIWCRNVCLCEFPFCECTVCNESADSVYVSMRVCACLRVRAQVCFYSSFLVYLGSICAINCLSLCTCVWVEKREHPP